MQSVLELACMLMGSAKETDPGDSTQGRAGIQMEEAGRVNSSKSSFSPTACRRC